MSGAGPSSFEMTQRMGSGGGGGGGKLTEGISRSLIGMNMEQETSVNFKSEKDLHLTGADNMEPGLLAMLFKARGEGFFARFFDALASREEAFGTHAMGEGHGGSASGGGESGSGGGGGGGAAGSNRPFSSMPPMDMMGPMSDVSPAMLGRLTPTATPSVGRGGHGMDSGMGM